MNNKKRRSKKRIPEPVICNNCSHCIYIGDGDFICENEPGSIVLEYFVPSDDFMMCNGKEFDPS